MEETETPAVEKAEEEKINEEAKKVIELPKKEEPEKPKEYSVGDSVIFLNGTTDSIKTSLAKVHSVEMSLGRARANYLAQERALEAQLKLAQDEANAMATIVGKMNGLKMETESWQFQESTGAFVRLG